MFTLVGLWSVPLELMRSEWMSCLSGFCSYMFSSETRKEPLFHDTSQSNRCAVPRLALSFSPTPLAIFYSSLHSDLPHVYKNLRQNMKPKKLHKQEHLHTIQCIWKFSHFMSVQSRMLIIFPWSIKRGTLKNRFP